jgi:anthranilate phosphoribosyltransferase
VRQDTIDPSRLGVAPALPADLVGGDASYNAQVVRDLLAGRPGPVRDAVLINAAGAVAVFNGLSGDVHADMLAAKDVAAKAIDSGAAAALLDRWITLSSKLAATDQ